MNQLGWILPTAVCAVWVVWYAVRCLTRDELDPDCYEVREQWWVLAGGILFMCGACAIGYGAVYTDILEGEALPVYIVVAVGYALTLFLGTYSTAGYFARRITVGRWEVTYQNLLGVRGVWHIDQIRKVELGTETPFGSTIRVLGENKKVLFKLETNMKNGKKFYKDMQNRLGKRTAHKAG